ncbi:tRNA/rRNA methyltransferase (SpoU) [Desulfotomaculum nigrificans CO-1-SRB]|uniref:tRNA/rRNA methyltransferase (SpoU) n=1 Tax=Desulfotomaculum nigrificans (strain DSM 14880 / VKM B-2319 / CO-1-SRB) TaxID=868595 RepID=F6B408_DESCC|nr:RNA methyltransferase [Desulfotomaculum nigrificans]AEF94063.1 tRNA/rRNA methyltransferase (SpoU) [Desulfotomaculum nigrificans CO-1-SRB]
MIITAAQNPKIKYIRRLAQRNFREKERKLVVEGVRLVEEALQSGWRTESFVYTYEAVQNERGSRLLELAQRKCAQTYQVTAHIMSQLSDTETPQGVLAVLWQPDYVLADVLPGQPPLVVVVDGVQDPGNLGTIVRSADAAGASGVVLLKGTVDIYNPKTIRATMGSLFHLPVVTAEDVDGALAYLASAGVTLIVGDPVLGEPIFKANLKVPVAIMVGNEGAGPRADLNRFKHVKVNIPMPGRAESLNVAMATSIMLYEAVRQRT